MSFSLIIQFGNVVLKELVSCVARVVFVYTSRVLSCENYLLQTSHPLGLS